MSPSPTRLMSPSPTQPLVSSRFGFFPPPASQHPSSAPSPSSEVPPSPLPPPSPSPVYPSSGRVGLHTDATPPAPADPADPESGPDEGEGNNEEMEIDETSDGEDDRRAHEFLQATPVQTGAVGGNSPILLPHDNHDFAVCFFPPVHRPHDHQLTCFAGAKFESVGPSAAPLAKPGSEGPSTFTTSTLATTPTIGPCHWVHRTLFVINN